MSWRGARVRPCTSRLAGPRAPGCRSSTSSRHPATVAPNARTGRAPSVVAKAWVLGVDGVAPAPDEQRSYDARALTALAFRGRSSSLGRRSLDERRSSAASVYSPPVRTLAFRREAEAGHQVRWPPLPSHGTGVMRGRPGTLRLLCRRLAPTEADARDL